MADDGFGRLVQLQDRIIDRHEAAFKEILAEINSVKTDIALAKQKLESLESRLQWLSDAQRKDENLKAKITGVVLVLSLIVGWIMQVVKDKYFP